MGFAPFDEPLKLYAVYVCPSDPEDDGLCEDTTVDTKASECPTCGKARQAIEVANTDRALQIYELIA